MCRKEDRMHVARIMAQDGHSQKTIAEKLGVSDRMVRKYLKPDFGTRPRKVKKSILEPFTSSSMRCWRTTRLSIWYRCTNGSSAVDTPAA
jgi:transposase